MDVRINVNSSGYHSFGESIHSRVFPLLDAMKKFVYYTLPMFFKISEPFSFSLIQTQLIMLTTTTHSTAINMDRDSNLNVCNG